MIHQGEQTEQDYRTPVLFEYMRQYISRQIFAVVRKSKQERTQEILGKGHFPPPIRMVEHRSQMNISEGYRIKELEGTVVVFQFSPLVKQETLCHSRPMAAKSLFKSLQ